MRWERGGTWIRWGGILNSGPVYRRKELEEDDLCHFHPLLWEAGVVGSRIRLRIKNSVHSV